MIHAVELDSMPFSSLRCHIPITVSRFNFQQFKVAVFELRSVGQCRAMNRGIGPHSFRGIGLRI